MHKALLFILAVGGGCAVLAQATQPVPPQRDADAEMVSAQKRTELRKVLSAGRQTEPASRDEQGEPAGRQLTQQQRAEMREQLRRYRPPAVPRAQKP